VELAYSAQRFSMVILVPDEVDGLPGLEKKLTPANLAGWLDAPKPEEVRVRLPRFTLATGLELREPLTEMGMGRAFDEKADFTGVNDAETLFISAVIHKAFVEVNEEGTEAAAATAVAYAGNGHTPPRVYADHPFFFLIRDRTSRAILFLGRLAEPAGARAGNPLKAPKR
jgi:serpin B